MKNAIYFVSLFFVACGQQEQPNDKTLDRIEVIPESKTDEDVIENNEEEFIPANIPVFAMEGLDFGFAGYIVSIDSMDIIDYKGDLILPKNDTCSYNLDLGEHIVNSPLRVSPTIDNEFISFEVFQRALFHFSISNEGPHCDMLDEEPIYSIWIKLKSSEPNYGYRTLTWDDIETPQITMSEEEFKDLTLRHCNEHYALLLDRDYFSSDPQDHILTSGYEIKIEATRSDGTVKTSFIYLSSPMGC